MLRRIAADPSVVFLFDDGPAKWIGFDEPFDARARTEGTTTRAFRTRIVIKNQPLDAALRIRALKSWNVRVDGQLIGRGDMTQWKAEYPVQLAPVLTPGEHELKVYIQNAYGPCAVRLRCDPIDIHTDAQWEATADDQSWTPARLAAVRPAAAVSRQFDTVGSAFAHIWPVLALVFASAFAASLSWPRWRLYPGQWRLSPGVVRWGIIGAWGLLGINNILKLPTAAGFDAVGHMEYVAYLLNHKRVPLATDGWQMFQSPLYYLIAAPLYALFEKISTPETAFPLLRSISLAAGALQIEICFRAVRLVFPERRDLQILGTIFAGFVPMNLYLSQTVSNEPFSSCLGSFLIYLCIREIVGTRQPRHLDFIIIGVVFGLALLAKFSAVILVAPLALMFASRAMTSPQTGFGNVTHVARDAALVGCMAAAVAGWYYARNWIHLGQIFVGGWDLSRGIPWWQDPGYRMIGDLFRFGSALVHPIYASSVGFWDGVYATFWCDSLLSSAASVASRPPWNYSYLLTSVWLAVFPCLGLLLGACTVFGTSAALSQRRVLLFSLACIGAYGLALLHHFLTVPYYCTVKSFYTLGAMPCYALLAVTGFELLLRNTVTRSLLCGGLAAWSVSIYITYFIR